MSQTPATNIVGAVLLGAGYGRRFGSDKRLHPLKGRSVAECTVDKYVTVFTHVRVVVRPGDDQLLAKLDQFPVDIIVAEEAFKGMGHSLSAGVADLTWTWAFIALLDMPFVSIATLSELRDQAANRTAPGILQPRLKPASAATGDRGHPVGWHRGYFDQLGVTRGDVGAKALLASQAQSVTLINFEDIGIVQDIDRPADLTNPGP